MDATTPAGAAASLGLERLEDDHQIQRALCRDLEAIADMLPGTAQPAAIRRIGERIERIAVEHFPRALTVLGALPAAAGPTPEELVMLETMQAVDATHGEDLTTALWRHVAADPASNVGQLGYMLRCYFDGCRRAIALKESLIARARAHAIFSSDMRSAGASRG